jgi:hypothetical protein
MRPSQTFDPTLHEEGTPAAQGRCSWHTGEHTGSSSRTECASEAVVSFQDGQGQWESGCRLALEDLVERGEIEPLGQGA